MITLQEMADLARALLDADKDADDAELVLKHAKERARQLREETIPSAMQELGLDEVKLSTGQTVSIKQDVYASISDENKPKAFAWLNEHDFGGIIKTDVIVAFGKGEQEAASALAQEMRENDLDASVKEGVHPQTLKAFLREQIASGSSVPLELFGARPVWTTKISNK